MKTRTKISEITHDDLVDLFSTALYGSWWLTANCKKSEYMNSNPQENDCYEDKLARCLLSGYSIIISDRYAEDKDDSYGHLPFKWNKDYHQMDYIVTLKDIERGIGKAIDNGNYSAMCAMNLVNADNGEFDQPQAEELIQWIIFGESVYG